MLLAPEVEGPKVAARACLHCGSPISAGSRPGGDFCCSGCAYVHQLVCAHGLDAFYKIKDKVTPPADAVVFEPRNLEWLRALQADAETRAAARPPEAVVGVQGVSCAACIWLIERLFHEEAGAREIVANAQRGSIRLTWNRGQFDAEGWARRLQGFGYIVGPAGKEPERPESALLVKRIGLCSALALNVMLFALPAYFGMRPDFEYAGLFRILSLILATLSVLVGGTYFIARAARALRAGAVHIDLPIAIGILGSYAGSVSGWLMNWPRLFYPDFVATFIVLMLVGRWSQVAVTERNRRRLLSHRDGDGIVRLPAGGTQPVNKITEGLRYLAGAGDTVPVDSRLESNSATFSLASINGEPEPRVFREGDTVPSGAVSLDRGTSFLRARQPWAGSLLAQLLASREKPRFQNRQMEIVVKGYLVAIIVGAALVGLGWCVATGDPLRAGEAAIAVLVVSCPCAIGIALPLADELATLAARAHGVFVREWDLWSRLSQVRKIIFDKTGTLTLENPVLRNPEALAALGDAERSALVGLVQDSMHPIGRCLHEALLADGARPGEAMDVEEVVGFGVFAGPWSLGRAGWHDSGPPGAGTVFARSGRHLSTFAFADAVRPGVDAELKALETGGREVHILSGDGQEKVDRLAVHLGVEASRAHGGLSPAGKAEWIKRHAPSEALMLGDGANDSLAFDTALCRGTPVVHRGVLESKADFYYLRRGIGGIRDLLSINSRLRRVKLAVLVFSVCYNIGAAACAAAGLINPLVAAVLMPASSLISLAIVVCGMRTGAQQ
jgi:P-type Cu2+ transporter